MAEKSERAQREEKILQFWKENKIFEKSLEKDSPKGEFVFYDGPPFATGLPHYGHILTGTIKDVIPRYKTMKGFHVSRCWGWDCHGLPIENLIEKELGLETRKDIEKFGIAEFNSRARASVLKFEKQWKEIIPRTGRWIDMDNAYKTMDSSYTESVWWSFNELYNKGLIYQSFKSMHICPHCETTLSNFEVNQGYKDITDISVYVKFELVDEPDTYLLAWTTTPWTLPGNVALAVKSDALYVKVKKDKEILVLLKSLLEKVLKDNYEIVGEIYGKDLVDKRYKTPFNYYQMEGQVCAADFVNVDEGTGIVHIAPAFGENDYELSLKYKLPFVQHVGMDGCFKPEVTDFSGELVKPKDDHQATDIKIIKYLAGKNLLFAKEKIVHSYPHCWRCDTPLLNYATYSWFLKVTGIKEKVIKNNQKVGWVPEDIRDGRFGKWLEGARDWAISRTRFWGTPLPIWQNADGSKRIVIDSIDTLKKHTKTNKNHFIFVRHGEAESNVKDLINCDPSTPFHLTDKGKQESKEAAKKIRKVDAIYSSPYLRTKESAEIIAEELGFNREEIKEDARLVELNFGDFGEKHFSSYLDYEEKHILTYDTPFPNGESYQDAKNRFGEFLYDIDAKRQGETIVVVTHGIGLETVAALVEGADLKRSKEIIDVYAPEPGEIFAFDFVSFPHNENFELDLHKPYIDEVVLVKDGEEYRRIKEIFDTWYDSGSVPFASRGAKDFLPADFIAEGLDQTRGWFYTMIVLGTALFDESPYQQVVVNGLILAEDGKKMSKRLKNYPELTYVLDKYGADALRYYLMSSASVRAEDLTFSEKGLNEVVKKNLSRLENIVSFYELYAVEQNDKKTLTKNILDHWIDIRLAQLIADVTEGLDKYEIDKASRPIADFIDDLSTWYLRRSRTRLEALPKLREVLLNFAKILAPLMPFIAEDIHQRLKFEKSLESVHLEHWPVVKKPLFSFFSRSADRDLIRDMEETRRIASLALEARSKANIKVRQPLNELKIRNKKLRKEFLVLIADEINVKKVSVDVNLNEEVQLDTNLTAELLEEGKMRDAIRAVQEWRKEQGLKPGEKVDYKVSEQDKRFFMKYKLKIENSTNVKLIEN